MNRLIPTLALFCLAVSAAAQMPSGAYQYDGSGNVKSIGTDQYSYDAFGRLTSADVGVGADHQSFTYDRYGNLTAITTQSASVAIVPGVDPATNQLSLSGAPYNATATYDDNGRVLSYLNDTFTYDALDNVNDAVVDGYRHVYLYSASDERIATVAIVGNAKASAEWTVRDPQGQVLRRFDENGSGTFTWREDYVYRDGQLLAAEVDTNQKTLHFHLDHLGTPRLITGNGGVKLSEHTYYPFGLEFTSSLQDTEKRKFTGHERDSSVLDYMHARYYAVPWGRFLSVDPVLDPQRAIPKPQAWNRYTYVENNPIRSTDPDGRECGGCAAADRDIRDLASGRLSVAEYNNRNTARGVGAVTGLLALGVVYAGSRIGPAATSFASELGLIAATRYRAFYDLATSWLESETFSPSEIRFTQNSIKAAFKDGGAVDEMISGLKSGAIKATDVAPIRIFKQDGKIFTLDNRRLYAFQQAGIKTVKAVWATAEEIAKEVPKKMTTENNGASVYLRGRQ